MGRKKYIQLATTHITQEKTTIIIDEEYVQLYHCFLEASIGIRTVSAYQLFFWLSIQKMNKDNGVHIGEKTLEAFNEYIGQYCEDCIISRTTFYRAAEELASAGILKKIGRAVYYINAEFFWRGSVKSRTDFLVSEHLEKIKQLPYNPDQK